ncbi:MAG: PilN domain-containing protein [Desulfocapsa sp.]|nr:PilN domain-containing protein [Desulfocapsa sp.]
MASKILSIDLQSDLLTAVLLGNDVNKNIIASTALTTAGKTSEELIGELTTTLDCSDCRCFLSLGASLFSFRNLTLPFSDRKSIKKILPFELEESIAAPIDTMLIDAIVDSGEGEDSEILAAMIQREILAAYYNALKDAGITLEIITLSGPPTIAAIQANGQAPEEFIFLDLRLKDCSLFLLSSGKLQLVRSLAFNPQPIAATAEEEEVEGEVKTGFYSDPESGALQVQGLEENEEALHNLARAVKQTLTPLPLTTPLEQLPIYIDGSASTTEKVSAWLEAPAAFNRPCLICGRAGLLPLPIGMPEKTKQHAAFLTACLSLGTQGEELKNSSFNFCKEEFTFRKKLVEYRNLGKLIGILLIAVLLFGLGTLWYHTESLKRQRSALVTEIHGLFKETLPEVTRIVDPMQQLQVAVDSIRLSSDEDGDPILAYTVLHILRELSSHIPESLDVRLTRLIYESKGLRITGLTDSFNTVENVKNNLQKSQDFANVVISSTKQDLKNNKINFELRIETGVSTP